jgi:OmcA/MtrC family decaheme c-type cytochrome
MRRRSILTGTPWILAGSILVFSALAAGRPARQNKAYNPAAAAQFPSVTTGVNVKIKNAAIAKDGTITCRFTMTDSLGHGLDIDGIQTAGTLSVRFVAATIPNGKTQYVAYTTTVLKSSLNSNPAQTQAGTDAGGKFVLIDGTTGTYDYTFGVKAPGAFDATATHSIGMQAERNLSAYGIAEVASDDDVFTFVPNGSPVSTIRDVVNESSCNSCHNPISAHGGGRKTMAYCVMCHTPQSVNPDTQNTVDMAVFIHKLHKGSSLPSVKAGQPYQIYHRGTMQDYSEIVFPQDIRNCTTCHAEGTKQANNWKTNPTRAACGSCHDNVNFDTGLNHLNLAQPNDKQCKGCHSSGTGGEFDASIPGAHTIPNNSASCPGVVMQILNVENAKAGSAPTVTFQVTDKAGVPVDISKLTRLRVTLAGPNTDYGVGATGVRVSEDPTKTPGSNGVYTYTMAAKIPAGAAGSYTMTLEGTNTVTLMAGTMKQTTGSDNAKPVQYYFSVDNSPVVARRQVVSTEKCNACHQQLTFVHGGARAATQECVVCHNPTLTDGTSKQSVSFATQIHSIHRGENLANPYILGTTNYQEVKFPGDLRDCTTCHVNNSYRVENVGAVAMVASPGGFVANTAPIAAACQGCHDEKSTASHALANTTSLGESCATCHSASSEFAVDKVHARGQ